MKKPGKICFLILIATISLQLPGSAQTRNIIVDSLTTLVDGTVSPFNQVGPGDTVFFLGGARKYLSISNFSGTSENPVVFTNRSGPVTINTAHYYGISINNCRNFFLCLYKQSYKQKHCKENKSVLLHIVIIDP